MAAQTTTRTDFQQVWQCLIDAGVTPNLVNDAALAADPARYLVNAGVTPALVHDAFDR